MDSQGIFCCVSHNSWRLQTIRGCRRERRNVALPLVLVLVRLIRVTSDLFSAPERHLPRLICGSRDRAPYPRVSLQPRGRPRPPIPRSGAVLNFDSLLVSCIVQNREGCKMNGSTFRGYTFAQHCTTCASLAQTCEASLSLRTTFHAVGAPAVGLASPSRLRLRTTEHGFGG